MTMLQAVLAILFSFATLEHAFAKEIPVQARVFAGVSNIDPKAANAEFEAQGLKKANQVVQYGLEVTYPVANFLDLGLRFTKRNIVRDEVDSSPATEYRAEINQDSALVVARIPFFKSAFVRLDGFGGIGGTNTTLKMKTATQDGELSRKESGDWFATPYASYGGSIAIGYLHYFLVIEGGMESNKIGGLKSSGNIGNNIDSLDLSGSFFSIGFLFDGMGNIK
jgi:hypothetical protein